MPPPYPVPQLWRIVTPSASNTCPYIRKPSRRGMDVKAFIPDFLFDPENPEKYSARCFQHTPPKQFLTIGAGLPGMVCAHEFMHVGLPPILLEAADRMGGRPYSKKGNSGKGAICEPGGMIFPFPPNHYSTILVDRSDLELGGETPIFSTRFSYGCASSTVD